MISEVPRLLVSVRSPDEARLAVAGGASIIDIKEPSRGSLGRADFSVWTQVREAVPEHVPVSVALGELSEWLAPGAASPPPEVWRGLSYRKLGLSRSSPEWRRDWAGLRTRLGESKTPWIAVAYADWQAAGAPDPDSVLNAALDSPEIVGVLVDTWDKGCRPEFGPAWQDWMDRGKRAGKVLALAGGIGLESIPHLLKFQPDVIAVRGAACLHGDRQAAIDPGRLAELARALKSPTHDPRSNLTPWASGRSWP